jgi:hypothetical protein
VRVLHQRGTATNVCFMRPEVVALVERGPLPVESEDEALWVAWQAAVDALQPPATDEEAIAAVRVLPHSESSAFGLAWAVLHFVGSAPNWPLPDGLAHDQPWVQILRERAEGRREFVGFAWPRSDFLDQMGLLVEAVDVTKAGTVVRAALGSDFEVSLWNEEDAKRPR